MAKSGIPVFEALVRYALARYGDKYDEVAPGCPYETRMGGDRAFRQEVSWFVYEWTNPDTGRTILEEFVESKVRGREQAARLLLRKEIISDTFEVMTDRDDKSHTATVRAAGTQREYNTVVPKACKKGSRLVGRIHPRDKDTYMPCGVLTRPGEWDDDRLEAAAARAGLDSREIESAKIAADVISNTRFGPGRDKSLIAEQRVMAMLTKLNDDGAGADPSSTPPERDSHDHGGVEDDSPPPIDPDLMSTVVDMYSKDEAAFEAAMSARISPGADLKTALDAYPTHMLWSICRRCDIGSLPSRDAMIERISDRLPVQVCANLHRMSEDQKRALALVAYNGFMPYPECMHVLVQYAEAPLGIAPPDDEFLVDDLIRHYVETGLLIIGTVTKDGRDQPIITVASDIRRVLQGCSGWHAYTAAVALLEAQTPRDG